jgi:hypothetical protein
MRALQLRASCQADACSAVGWLHLHAGLEAHLQLLQRGNGPEGMMGKERKGVAEGRWCGGYLACREGSLAIAGMSKSDSEGTS